MDADKFESVFHATCSVTRVGDDGKVSVMPIETWLAAVRKMEARKKLGLERHDETLSTDVERDLALVRLSLQIPPRYMTDMLSCLRVGGTWKFPQK
jgi:hypothetical protein